MKKLVLAFALLLFASAFLSSDEPRIFSRAGWTIPKAGNDGLIYEAWTDGTFDPQEDYRIRSWTSVIEDGAYSPTGRGWGYGIQTWNGWRWHDSNQNFTSDYDAPLVGEIPAVTELESGVWTLFTLEERRISAFGTVYWHQARTSGKLWCDPGGASQIDFELNNVTVDSNQTIDFDIDIAGTNLPSSGYKYSLYVYDYEGLDHWDLVESGPVNNFLIQSSGTTSVAGQPVKVEFPLQATVRFRVELYHEDTPVLSRWYLENCIDKSEEIEPVTLIE